LRAEHHSADDMAVYWGRACCLPCDALAAMCEGCSRACNGLCERCDCTVCCCPPGKPSPVFLSYTLLVCGLPQAVAAVAGLVALKDKCDQNLQLYLILNVRLLGSSSQHRPRHSPSSAITAHASSSTPLADSAGGVLLQTKPVGHGQWC
jgi:hypothetical protein